MLGNQHTRRMDDLRHIGQLWLAIKSTDQPFHGLDTDVENGVAGSAYRLQIVDAMIILGSNMVDLLKASGFPPTIDTSEVVTLEHLTPNALPLILIALVIPFRATHNRSTQDLRHTDVPFHSEKSSIEAYFSS